MWGGLDLATAGTAWALSAAVFLAADAIWLGLIARGFYARAMGALLRPRPNFVIAGLFYLVFVAGLVHFAVGPALGGGGWHAAAVQGALFGFFCYATYDFTNWATLRDWPVSVTIVDVAWGTVLSGASSVCGYVLTLHVLG